MFYVIMTDNFMSGWGKAAEKTNKYIVKCETIEQAQQIKRAAKLRPEMESVHIRKDNAPLYNPKTFEVTYTSYDKLGGSWLEED